MKFDQICKTIFNETAPSIRLPQFSQKKQSLSMLSEMAAQAVSYIPAPDADPSVLEAKSDNYQKIFNAYAEEPGTTIGDLSRRFNKRFQIIRHYTKTLEKMGLIIQAGAVDVVRKSSIGAPTQRTDSKGIKIPLLSPRKVGMFRDAIESAFYDDKPKTEEQIADIVLTNAFITDLYVTNVATSKSKTKASADLTNMLDYFVKSDFLEKTPEGLYILKGESSIGDERADSAIDDAGWLAGGEEDDITQYIDMGGREMQGYE
jgi:hypothetical protein